MTNFHDEEDNSDGENRLDQERVFRAAVIIGVIVAVLVLISAGIYVGLKVLRSPTSTPPASKLEIDDDFSRLSATATAACATFLEQFSGTPCPPAEDPNILATATQACAVFIEQFPGTPCPP